MENATPSASIKTVATNRKARHDYHLLDRYEAGVVLLGTEVKAVRAGKLNLADSYARIDDGEIFLVNAYIGPYEHGSYENHEPKRNRKLLLNRSEIKKINAKTGSAGMTIVPTKAYFSNGKMKIEIALARGKHSYDKREDLRKETDQRAVRSYLG